MPYYSYNLLEQACFQLGFPILEVSSVTITDASASYAWFLEGVYQVILMLSFYPDGSSSIAYVETNDDDDVGTATITYSASSLRQLSRNYHELLCDEILAEMSN